ncbi:hypothetical protein BKP45_20810 [Anaerobacillus alkalidiazotrophicus]|uniref:Endospore appendages core domain-containing protein n=1 Tax=Anaerobacillus alkalidiazotrophicus TaxID=472963 RepID=A0A1S2LWN2_9BACI|nr:S-Ena type endospore appendage [Anaerobacillus alkalidiazotrophicus]OIJ16938.1 hypothetical protein BKP45_20810 [Anaerobacillus alkalidiazotrophicus]
MAQLGKCFPTTLCCVNDAVCCDISVTVGTGPVDLYTNSTNFPVNGTFMVDNSNSSTGNVTLTDGTNAIDVAPGTCQAITYSDINNGESITWQTTAAADFKVSFSINYKF